MPFDLTDQDILYLIYCGIGVGVLVLFSGLAQLFSTKENLNEAKSRRMRLIAEGKSTAEVIALLRPPERTGLLSRMPVVGNLAGNLKKAGILMSSTQFLLLCGGAVLVIFVASTQFVRPELAMIGAVTVGLVVPLVVVSARVNQRQDALVRQLPDALDLMSRGLRVGHPLNTSIGAVAQEMPDPIGSEFGLVFDQVSYGDDLVDAFKEFAERCDIEDVNYLSSSIGIQHGTGGDLVRVLEVLSKTIRERISMRRRIKAISAEGRMSAWFLSVLPLVIFGFTSVTTPDYYGGVLNEPMFRPMAITVVGLVVANAIILRRLVNFRI